MRIAIVDDAAGDRRQLKNAVQNQLSRLFQPAQIEEFKTGAAFLKAAGQERFELVFLDIYMESENGVDTARALRAFDEQCLLVFTTTSPDFALEGYRVRAFHYLLKPVAEADLQTLFEEISRLHPAKEPFLSVNTNSGTMRIRYADILYASHYQHRIHIHCTGGREVVTRLTFRELCARLQDERFFVCSRGVLVSLEQAADFDGRDFVLKSGERVPVSRDLAKNARNAFGDFLFARQERL